MKFAGTFGQKYADAPHPSGLPAHPDGYVRIDAPTMEGARALLISLYGRAWAGCYELDALDRDAFPLGELAAFSHDREPEVTVDDEGDLFIGGRRYTLETAAALVDEIQAALQAAETKKNETEQRRRALAETKERRHDDMF